MRNLLATTCIPAIALMLGAGSSASATTITGTRTAGVATSTVDSGTAADLTISSTGSISPASGTAVTIDSSNSVSNAGTISITGADGAIGVLANSGVSGSITNSGTVTVTESYTQSDTNGDGVVDGAFAEGSDRFGIETAGALTGDITNSGTITVKGNDSVGILLGGPLTGSLSQTGTITVTGDDSVGISANAVTGDVGIAGTITATGANTSAVLLNGDIGGALTVQGTLTSTGYTSTTLPTTTTSLTADNLLQGGPTLQVAGSVTGGVLLTAAATTTDSSGTSTTTTAATLTSYGSAPALLVGSATRDITIGAIASDTNGYGLEINGSLAALGVYDGVAAHTLVIGGQGGGVSIAGGASIAGTVTATSNDASATAVEIGSGATVPVLTNSGTVSAKGAYAAGQASTAILIDAGATMPTLVNSGTISAVAETDAADTTAIVDKSGTLASITNTGTISATVGASNVAIDLSANTTGATITQSASGTTTTPSITGDILFGSGTNLLAISSGTVAGALRYAGAGSNSLALSGTGSYSGAADFGGGTGTLGITDTASFSGTIANSAGIGISVSGGTLTDTAAETVSATSLSVTNGGTLGVTIDGTTGAATLYQVSGAASFDSGSKIALHFSDISHVAGTYTLVEAGSLTGASNLTTSATTLPYLFKSSLTATDTSVGVTVARKTAADLGLNRAGTASYDAIYTALGTDKQIGDAFLNFTDAASLDKALRTMMPDFAGGTFDNVSLASRQSARMLQDPDAPVQQIGDHFGVWLQQVGWFHRKSEGESQGYKVSGWGLSGGAEVKAGPVGRFGVSLSWFAGDDKEADVDNDVGSNQFELAGYWRADWGGLHAYARGSIGRVNFKSSRRLTGEDDGTSFTREADGKWTGNMMSGSGGLSYTLTLGSFSLRPQGSVDYYRLHEDSYAETGGGVGMDLIVDGRTSNEFAANGALALGYAILRDDSDDDGTFMRVEVEGGRRQVINGTLGATTAHFAGGDDFTLVPDERTGGWTAATRLKGGNNSFTVSGEVDGQREQGSMAVAFRLGLQAAF